MAKKRNRNLRRSRIPWLYYAPHTKKGIRNDISWSWAGILFRKLKKKSS